VLKSSAFRLLEKILEARRAKTRRAEAYIDGTSERASERNQAYESLSAA
jgi:hypothetical protein